MIEAELDAALAREASPVRRYLIEVCREHLVRLVELRLQHRMLLLAQRSLASARSCRAGGLRTL
jgi:hypothetical protein